MNFPSYLPTSLLALFLLKVEECSGHRLVFTAKGTGGFNRMNKCSFHFLTTSLFWVRLQENKKRWCISRHFHNLVGRGYFVRKQCIIIVKTKAILFCGIQAQLLLNILSWTFNIYCSFLHFSKMVVLRDGNQKHL